MILTKSKVDKVDIDQLIYEKINSGKFNELVLIVPTNRKVRYLKRELISNAPNQTASELNLETIATLLTKLFDEARNFEAKILSDAAAVVLLNQSFSEVNLQYFNDYKKEIPRGTLELVKNVISEYKRQGISPEDIERESVSLTSSEKFKALDIANIFSAYRNKTNELNAFELGDIYKYLDELNNENLLHTFREVYPKANTIIVNGFDEFSQPEIEILNRLSNLNNISLYFSFDYYKYNREIFAHLENCYDKLNAKGFFEIQDHSVSSLDDFRKKVRENLFSIQKIEPHRPNLKITKIVAANPVKEIETIAKEIKRLIIDDRVKADEICVAFNMISEHAVLIRDIFSSYGIPFNLTDRFTLSNSAPVIALINLLEIIENDFYFKNIFRALSGRWIEIPGVDISSLLLVSANLKLVAGYKNWINSIENVLEQIHNGNDDEDANYLPRWQYEKAKNDIQKINDLLSSFKMKQTCKSFKENLFAILSSLQFAARLINDDSDYIEKNVKAISIFVETIEELFDLLEDQFGNSKSFTLSFFLHEIKTALLFNRYNIKERHDKGVLVTSVNEIRGLRFKYLFLGGMVDGEFPTRYQPAIFFSGEHRKQRDERRHLLEERYRFYQAMCVPEKCLYLTSPLKGDKQELTESSFLTDLEKLFYVENKSESDFTIFISSKEELLKVFGKSGCEDSSELLNLDEINEAIKIDSLRQSNTFAESPYTGYINENLDSEAKNKLFSYREREYSASQLEEYAKCPFRYFVNRVLSLETIEEPSEEVEAFEIGSLIHSIFYRFYSEIHEKGIKLSRCTDEEFEAAEKLLFKIAEEKVSKIQFASPSSFFEREKIFGINGKKENSILYHFLLTERESEEGYIPEFFEYAFGNISNSRIASVLVGNEIKLRGKVDRIELNKNDKTFKVVDYKLGGKKPSGNDLSEGISLQLPLYMYASKILIKAELDEDYNPFAAEIYSLKLTKKDFGRNAISILSTRKMNRDERIEMNENIIKIAIESIVKYVNLISCGDFRLSQLQGRETKVCNYCEFKSVCRIQELA